MRAEVAIVGCGPVGALLANLLGQAGHSVLVFEREAGVYHLPRAAHFDGEVMRMFQSAGLFDAMSARVRAGHQGMRFVNATGQLLLERKGLAGPGPHGHAGNYYFHQPEMEEVLRTGLERFERVRLLSRHDVYALADAGDHVDLRVENMANGELIDVRADYVVGCDGARSLVRRMLGSRNLDLGLHQPWLVVDAILKRPVDLPTHTVQYCDPARPRTYVNMVGNRRRWEIMLLPGEDAARVAREENVWKLLGDHLSRDDADFERAVVYTFHSVIAQGWRRGRLMIAGDSAHQTPPFLGQGLCAGVRDAANLTWKLDRVLRKISPDTLLDTYETERAPHVRAFIDLAVKLGAIIQATDPVAAAARDRKFAEAPEVFAFPQPVLGPGVLVAGSPAAGTIFPQPRLHDGTPLDQALGAGFGVVARPLFAGHCAGWDGLARVIVARAGDALDTALAEQGIGAAVLRPDRYVYGAARDPAELAALAAAFRV